MDIKRSDVDALRRRKHFAFFGIGALLLLSLGLGVNLLARAPAVDADRIWTGTVKRGELIRAVAAAGTIIAPEVRAVTNRSDGVVERIRVRPGDRVGPDDVLLEMSSPQVEEDLAKAQYQLEAARAESALLRVELESRYLDSVAQLANAEAEYQGAKMELAAHERLAGQHVVSEIEVERTRLRAEQWRKRLDAEKARHANFTEYRASRKSATDAQLAQLQQEVARLRQKAADLHVRAGIAGTVEEVNVTEGERLASGQPIARVVNLENLLARVKVSERDAPHVQPDMPVLVMLGEHELQGRVQRLDPTVREQLVSVDVVFTSTSLPPLRPHVGVTARIELERAQNILIVERPVGVTGEFRNRHVFKLDSDGDSAQRVPVEFGRASLKEIEVISGLEEGDRIILTDLTDLQDRQEISIR